VPDFKFILNNSLFLKSIIYFTVIINLYIPSVLFSQQQADTLPSRVTLSQCTRYALSHQPLVQQSLLNEDVNERDISIALSGWFPQLNVNANLQHYTQLPTIFFASANNPSGPKVATAAGLINSSVVGISASQVIYNTELLFSGKASHDLRTLSRENTQNSQINTVVAVSKAFYDILITREQLDVLNEDIHRLERNYQDAYNLYQNGLSDKIDWQRTSIMLNNAKAEKRTTEEGINAKYSYLKQLMGVPPGKQFTISYDSSALERESHFDTLKKMNYDQRVEFQLIQTNLKIQNTKVGFYRWSFLPSLSAFYDYNFTWQNDEFSTLYKSDYPNSLIGLTLSLPLFQGTKRWQNLRKANLQYKNLELGAEYLKSEINSEYTLALAAYKSNLNQLETDRINTEVARGIFNTVKLQYIKGIKTYLEVIVSETDLRTAQLNWLNTLFRVLSSKLDLQKALGEIAIN
jgi:outer membrane protein